MAAPKPTDPLDLTVRALLERLLAGADPAGGDGGWVNVRDERWPWRQLVAAAERGEVSLSRVGHRLLMRRAELDRWLDGQRIRPRRPAAEPTPPRDEHLTRLLEGAGFRKR
jgi:hypothetical protein